VEPKTITDLIASQPTEVLEAMYRSSQDRIQEEVRDSQRIQAELQKRRNLNARKGSRRSGLKREDVLASLKRLGRATAPAVTALVMEQGYQVNTNAVRNHLVRLVADGAAIKNEDGTYTAVRGGEDSADDSSTNGQGHRLAPGDLVQGSIGELTQ
jgi:hypothetical protein